MPLMWITGVACVEKTGRPDFDTINKFNIIAVLPKIIL
jgi:hypothetical protein